MKRTPSTSSGHREPIHFPLLWVGYGICLAVGIPWYRDGGVIDPVIAGFPAWALVSALSCVGVAVLTAVAVLRLWTDDPEDEPDDPEPDGPEPDATPAEEKADG